MPRQQPSLAVFLSATIAISIVAASVLLGSAMSVQACLFTDGSVSPGNAVRQPGVSDSSVVTRVPGDSKPQSLGYAEFAGFGAIVGLFAIALFYNVRRSRDVTATGAELFNQHPQLEHPELALTSIPKEALQSVFDTEIVLVR